MKKLIALILSFVCFLGLVACNEESLNDQGTLSSNTTNKTPEITSIDQIYDMYGYIEYTCDLAVFPSDDIRNWFGEIVLVEDGKLLVSPGYKGKEEFGKVVWLICEYADAYSVGQVVTYTFCDVKAPDKEGAPLNIIALSVYME